MKERPIRLNDEMVRAVLSGAKTQTRRPMKPQPPDCWTLHDPCVVDGRYADGAIVSDLRCPFGAPGTVLWVRECWACRLTLRVKRVWVERVQQISCCDAMEEGAMSLSAYGVRPGYKAVFLESQRLGAKPPLGPGPHERFRYLWNGIYPGSWDRNEWVWCCEFESDATGKGAVR